MTAIRQQVRRAQRRLWMNRWLRQWGWCLLTAAAAWTLLLIADRLFALRWALGWYALAGLGLSAVASTIWLLFTRESALTAAAALDEAAGLRERVSTGLSTSSAGDDPFARAVMADAEQAVRALLPQKFLPLRWAASLSFSAIMLAVAAISLLLPEFDLLNRKEASAAMTAQQMQAKEIQRVLAKPVSAMQQVAEKNPDLKIAQDLRTLDDRLKRDTADHPDVLRRETVKQLDRLKDALKQKEAEERFRAFRETKKRLNNLGQPEDPKSDVAKLLDSMKANDFKSAQESIKQLQEKLARRARDGKTDPESIEKMQKQLNDLAEQLQKAAEDQAQSERELQNAGLSKKEAQRVLDALAKKDPKQVEKLARKLAEKLKQQGVTEEQMKKMLEKMQQRQQAAKQCEKMGQCMGSAASMMEQGQMGSAAEQLGDAGEMLSEMEMMEQALNDMQAQMSQLDAAKDDLLNQGNSQGPCQQCNGSGFRQDGAPCPHCNGTGRCNNVGRGGGTRERDDSVQTATVDRKAKIKQGRDGRIIGKQFVKGSPLRGHTRDELHEAASAAEIEATDALQRERVPAIYRKGVKHYFDRLGDDIDAIEPGDTAPSDDD